MTTTQQTKCQCSKGAKSMQCQVHPPTPLVLETNVPPASGYSPTKN